MVHLEQPAWPDVSFLTAALARRACVADIYPSLPLVAALRAQGCMVSVFVAPNIEDHLAEAIKASGAALRTYRESHLASPAEPLLAARTQRQEIVGRECRWLPSLLDDLRAMRPAPSVLVYDPFITIAPVVGVLTETPTVGLIPHSGPGWLAAAESDEQCAQLEGARRWVRQHFGADLLQHGRPPLSWFGSSTGMNLVLVCQELFSPPSTEQQRQRLGGVAFCCVGTLLDRGGRRPGASRADGALIDHVRAAAGAGTRVVLVSLGTLVTGAFWGALQTRKHVTHGPVDGGLAVRDNEDGTALPDGRCLHDLTGRELAHFIWRAILEALGGDATVLVVLATGKHSGALDGLPPLPRNFIAVPSVPQLDLLPLCSACKQLRAPARRAALPVKAHLLRPTPAPTSRFSPLRVPTLSQLPPRPPLTACARLPGRSAVITHGGMGSVMEAVLFRCPMAVIPAFADQPTNADAVERAGFGCSFRYPLRTLSGQALREAVRRLVDPSPTNSFRAALQTAAARMEAEGGATKAVELLFARAATVTPGAAQLVPARASTNGQR